MEATQTATVMESLNSPAAARPDAAQQAPPQATLHSLAREELKRHDNDTQKAADALVRRLHRNHPLLRAVIEHAIQTAVDTCVEHSMRGQRATILRSAEQGRTAAVAQGTFMARVLLDFPLANGRRLRDATREEVEEQAERYEHLADDMGRKARWLSAVAHLTPAGERVGKVISNERALELWNNVGE
jgi:hypothetical protein